jgi:hypothetical protein
MAIAARRQDQNSCLNTGRQTTIATGAAIAALAPSKTAMRFL